MQCPHCAMTVPVITDNCPYCGKHLTQIQAKKSISLRAFGASMLFDTTLMLAALVLPLAHQTDNEQVFRLINSISNQASQWPRLWALLSYGYLIVALLAFLSSVSCLITQRRIWALGALLCGLAGVALLATFGIALLNASGYGASFGLWIGLFGSFTLITTSTLFQVLTRK